jgi:glycosyltransferase involved in cell wall biosynthesis
VREVAAAYGARVLRLDQPGACRARNAGWRAALHDHIAFVDDDVLVLPGWADAMANALAEVRAAFVTGWIGVPPGQEDAPGPLPLMVDPEPRQLTVESRGALGAGANWGTRRDVLASCGGFDERIGPGTWLAAGEDQELWDRILVHGRTGSYHPEVRVDHEQWRGRWERVHLHWRYGKGMGARLARLARSHRRRFRQQAADAIWREGVLALADEARSRWLGGVLCSTARVTATVLVLVLEWLRGTRPLPMS